MLGPRHSYLNRKPPPTVRPNMGHPQMRGCIHFWPFNEGAGPVVHDVVGGNNANQNLSGTPDWAWAKTHTDGLTNKLVKDSYGRTFGPFIYYSDESVDEYMYLDNAVVRNDGQPFTWIMCFYYSNSSSGREIIGSSSTNARITTASDTKRMLIYDDGGQSDVCGDHVARDVDVIYQHAWVFPTDNNPIWYQDAVAPSASETGGQIDTCTWDYLSKHSTEPAGHVRYFYAAAFDRALSQNEIRSIYRQPFAPFTTSRPIWINTAGGAPTTYTGHSIVGLPV